jgi:hypothetical protein
MEPLKIGIVLNYKKAEKKKDELLDIKSKDWLLGADKRFTILRKKKVCVPADVAIGLYISSHYPGVIIDYITPEEISTRRFKKNDLVFIIIYDLLEAFHLSNRDNFYKFKLALKGSKNVYPPYEYQKFINNKCMYYKYLDKKGIPVAPTKCISREKWFTRNPEQYVNNLLSKVRHNKWESIIAKPVYGQESKDFSSFIVNSKGQIPKEKLIKYLTKNIPKYKSIVIQEYIKGFDKNNPEIRTYYINGIYAYSIITTSSDVVQPVQEGGTYRIPQKNWEYILSFSKRVMESLPKLDLVSGKSPILTRIDVGSGLSGAPFGYFINEVEFVPSLYIEDQPFPIVELISESLVKVANEYRSKVLPVKVIF